MCSFSGAGQWNGTRCRENTAARTRLGLFSSGNARSCRLCIDYYDWEGNERRRQQDPKAPWQWRSLEVSVTYLAQFEYSAPGQLLAGIDALHIAVAGVSGIQYLLTWNFEHIGVYRAIGHSEGFVHNSSGTPSKVPRTLKEVDLPRRIRAAGGAILKEAGELFGWEPTKTTKTSADFTKDQLLAKGWTKDRLLDVAEGYEHIARITPNNPSAAGRARQLREIAKLLD